eukprot:GGOE01047459.1.p3 GENE.GGOE01047459.1~~GGOE01047459.1.p3  ORF type:complete len:102 (+),score=0.13 GGOE01047459.1:500-805(+)
MKFWAILKAQVGQWVTRNGPLAVIARPHVPILAKVALTLFSLTPSEACVERCFSHQSLLHSDLRANLDDASVRPLMCVRMTTPRLLLTSPVENAAKEEVAE